MCWWRQTMYPIYPFQHRLSLWKRICAEATTEINLLAENWKYLLAGIVFQYIHGLAARGVHYLHRPGPTLQDLGFILLPNSPPLVNLSFSFIYFPSIAMDISSFYIQEQKDLHGSNMVQGSMLLSFPRGVIYGCGDLIFSSHMIFTLVFVLTYQRYGTRRCIKQLGWTLSVCQSLLIIASRKHYTVDVVVAWYTVNLVVFFVDKKLPELPDRTNAAATLLLPLSTKDNKDGRTKEENHKLLNGNSVVDPADWRQRTQANGKILEDGHTNHADTAMNGA
ncbi:hypothetical protein ACSQ67_016413 [Phaseolus vulgaris]